MRPLRTPQKTHNSILKGKYVVVRGKRNKRGGIIINIIDNIVYVSERNWNWAGDCCSSGLILTEDINTSFGNWTICNNENDFVYEMQKSD